MKLVFVNLVVLALGCSAFAEVATERADFKGCLSSISENSKLFKGKVFPMSSDGWSYVVSDQDSKETTMYLENGEVYKISPTKSKTAKLFQGPQTCKNVTETTRGKSGAGVVYALYEAAMSDVKNTSFESRKKIADSCQLVAAFGKVKVPNGMMMGGIPATGGMMTSKPGAK